MLVANSSSFQTWPVPSNRLKLLLSSKCLRSFRPKSSMNCWNLSSQLSLFPPRRRYCNSLFSKDVDCDDLSSGNGSSHSVPEHVCVKIPYGDRHILVETGHIGRQASGAVTVTDGETIIYTTVCFDDVAGEPSDFFPLSVHYQERFSAAGRTSGGFYKREGKTKDHEVLICRLIDRPLRPTMFKGFYHETQILSWVLSYDGVHQPDALAVTAAGIAVALSEVPTTKTIAGVRVGMVGGKFIVNPTIDEMKHSELDLILAGTKDAIFMIEGYCNFLPEEKLLEAVQVGQDAVRIICEEVEALVGRCGKQKMLEAIKLPPLELYDRVEEIAGDELTQILQIEKKVPRRKALVSLEERIINVLTDQGYVSKDEKITAAEPVVDVVEDDDEDEEVVDGEVDEGDVHIKPIARKLPFMTFKEVDVKLVFKEVASKFLRRRIVEGGKRSDGRNPDDIRPITSKCGLLPRAHGSALFTRGETQSLAVATVGDRQMAQKIDNLVDNEEFKRFYLQYSFPPSSVGEVGRIGAPSRREIGHGMLAERALEPILPSEEDFPYTVRVESTITESNGSSSMASVCGGCLAMQDAGVPVKSSIAGIAMGMVFDTKEFGGDGSPLILSDIAGSEDASGDMDFKVAGSEDGVTAFQMDIKVGGITLPVMRKALLQAKDGRKKILAEMLKCHPPPTKSLSKHAPLIHVMKVRPEKVNLIIGAGGKKVKSIIEDTGVDNIETNDDGTVKITAKNSSSIEKAESIISNLTFAPNVGEVYLNCEIKSIASYGVFVEIAPGREGLCHISELSSSWLSKAEDIVKVGDRVNVKLIEVNGKGQLRLSRKALLPDQDGDGDISENKSTEAAPTGDGRRESAAGKAVKRAKIESDDSGSQPQKKANKKPTPSAASDGAATSKEKPKRSAKKTTGSPEDSPLVNEDSMIG